MKLSIFVLFITLFGSNLVLGNPLFGQLFGSAINAAKEVTAAVGKALDFGEGIVDAVFGNGITKTLPTTETPVNQGGKTETPATSGAETDYTSSASVGDNPANNVEGAGDAVVADEVEASHAYAKDAIENSVIVEGDSQVEA